MSEAQPMREHRHIWVVEMLGSRWEPTVGAKLTKKEGRAELREWKHKNPSQKFIVTKYRRSR